MGKSLKTGALVYNAEFDRYDVRFDVNEYAGGLHCGMCFEVKLRGKWVQTRIEYGEKGWYLVRVCSGDLTGLMVRI